jgi:hypothetical protein
MLILLLTIACVLCVVGFGVLVVYARLDAEVELALAVACFVGVFAIIILWIILIAAHVFSIGWVTRTETLRADVARLGVDVRTEDVLGMVVQRNMTIATHRRYNETCLHWFYPDRIVNTPPILIPLE